MDAKELLQLGQRLLVDGKFRESIDAFTRSIEGGEDTEIAYMSRGVALVKDRQADRAIEDFTKSISLNKKNSRAHYYRGIACMVKEDYQRAVSDFDAAIRLTPDYGVAFFARGTAYAQIGDEEKAEKNIRTAITLMESNIQGFADSHGILRNQFDRALAVMMGDGVPSTMTLTHEEAAKIKKWIQA